jgi:hypothetical protein
MKTLLRCHGGASKRAALMIVLAFVVRDTICNPELAVATSDSCHFIASVTVVTGGSFYRVGDMLNPGYGTLCAPTDNYGFRLQVSSVDSNGAVTGVIIAPGGIGYSVVPANPVPFGGSPTGIGFTANCTFN